MLKQYFLSGISGRYLQWSCPNNAEHTFSYPVDDPPGKVWCDGCGQLHRLIPGKLSKSDLSLIEEMKRAANQDPEIHEYIEMRGEGKARSYYPTPETANGYGVGL